MGGEQSQNLSQKSRSEAQERGCGGEEKEK